MNADELRTATSALLAALKLRDEGTHDHSRRVARVSALLGLRLGLSREELLHLHTGAILHDIGKIQTKEAVLKKPGRHDYFECQHMKEHARAGAEMLSGLGFPSEVVSIVWEHHERCDGLGYPFMLKGSEICAGARIVAVADAFDAITNDRCYRAGRSYQAAAAAITRGVKTQFDQVVVEAFFQIPEEKLYERLPNILVSALPHAATLRA